MRKISLMAVLILILLSTSCSSGKSATNIARVNGETITKEELYQRLEKRAGKQVLDEMITEKLILQEAAKNKIKVTDKEIETKLADMKTRMGGEKSFNAQLKQSGYTLEDINKQVEIQTIVEKLLGKNVKITESEIKKFYDDNKEIRFKNKKLEEVRGQIAEALKQAKYEQELPKWIESLKKKSKIVNDLGKKT